MPEKKENPGLTQLQSLLLGFQLSMPVLRIFRIKLRCDLCDLMSLGKQFILDNYCLIRFGCWPVCCWSSYLWWSMPSFSGHLSCSVLISSTVMKLRRIVIHQRNLEKWRQEQLKEKKNESTTEVKKYQSQTNLIPSAE